MRDDANRAATAGDAQLSVKTDTRYAVLWIRRTIRPSEPNLPEVAEPREVVLAIPEREIVTFQVEQELARVDREWEAERRELILRGDDGHEIVPRSGAAVGIAVTAIVCGAALTWFTAHTRTGLLIASGPITIVVGVGLAIWMSKKAARYVRREREYRDRRLRATYSGNDDDDGCNRVVCGGATT